MRSMAQKSIRAVSKSRRPVATTRLAWARLQASSRRDSGDTPTEDQGAALRPGHVVEAGTRIKVMAAAGPSADGGSLAVAAVGENVAAGANG